MKGTIRKVALLAVVLVLIVGICVPAFAVYPKVTLYSRPTTARRGYYMYHKYYLNSNTYSYRSGYRSNFDGFIYRRATGRCYSKWDVNWSGRGYYTLKTAVYKSWPKGGYRTYVRTWYRPTVYSRWKFVRGFNWYFTVR